MRTGEPGPLRLLLLGGTTEASALARRLAGDRRFAAVLSLAGRTLEPADQPLTVRSGGFGGVAGLAEHLRREAVDLVVDATHPFAAQMSRHAIEACALAGVPLLAVERPAWQPRASDAWTSHGSLAAAVAALGSHRRIVFCGLGRLLLGALAAAPQHRYVVRLIDLPPSGLHLPDLHVIQARGPFSTADDIALFRAQRIEVVMAKNAGGTATVSKIEAARALGLPVLMIERPAIPARPVVATVEEAWSRLLAHHASSAKRGE